MDSDNKIRRAGFKAFRLPLLEMVLIIIIFIIVSAMITRIFISASAYSKRAADLRKADILLQNAAEIVRKDGLSEVIFTYGLLRSGQGEYGDAFETGLDEDFNATKEAERVEYYLDVVPTEKHAELGDDFYLSKNGKYGVMIDVYDKDRNLISSVSEVYVK
jgi:type II secretory pathway pseudopilin PulG